ncbi:MAG: Rrf2 family transcriptional regulator [Thiovulaceae bacterium]|nr:Rrf2 family transcriptional regulator [Sulfurimonadaceae bacterium]
MHLNATSQYALRVVSFMAINEQSLYTAKALADELNISYKYLTAIMTNLSKAEIISSMRGRGGGFRFSKALKDISLLDVLRVMNKFDDQECLMGHGKCNTANKCVLHDQWQEPKSKVYGMFSDTTLEDVKNNKGNLRI